MHLARGLHRRPTPPPRLWARTEMQRDRHTGPPHGPRPAPLRRRPRSRFPAAPRRARPRPATREWTHPRPVRPTRDPFAVDSHARPTHRRPSRYPSAPVDDRPIAPTPDLALPRATCPTRLDESHARVKDTQRRVRDPSMRLSQIRFLQNTFFCHVCILEMFMIYEFMISCFYHVTRTRILLTQIL